MLVPRLSRAEIISDLEQSLKNLQTDMIDIYWLHRDDETRPVEDIMETLLQQVKAGKIHYCGCSNWCAARIQAAQACAAQQGWPGFIADQLMWSMAIIDPIGQADKTMVIMNDELKQYHLNSKLPAIPYSSQAHGLFQRMAQGTVDQMKPNIKAMYDLAATAQRFERVRHLSQETGLSITDITLGYLLSQDFPVVPIVGCRNMAQLLDSMHAGDVRLTLDQVQYLDQN